MSISPKVLRLARFSLTTGNADHLASFYMSAFGCRRLGTQILRGPDFEALTGVQGGAICVRLAIGDDIIELLEFEQAGAPYPGGSSAADVIFQHFAIVVADMTEAWFRLSGTAGWSAITHGLPQRLPDSTGGVTAFKFRDPEGHPLELLSFPADRIPKRWSSPPAGQLFLGIDHSAISVANAAVSGAFYEGLGLDTTAVSANAGPEQDALDGLSSVHVEVVALSPEAGTAHVELLCYRARAPRAFACRSNDVACTRLVFEGMPGCGDGQRLSDPDGHHLILLSAPDFARPSP